MQLCVHTGVHACEYVVEEGDDVCLMRMNVYYLWVVQGFSIFLGHVCVCVCVYLWEVHVFGAGVWCCRYDAGVPREEVFPLLQA